MKPKVVVILGPTATGKSKCGIILAQKLGGEIISGDSMLVYKGMDVATAKPNKEELEAAPHHLVDILEPSEDFSVVDFKEKANALILDINKKGKLPIIVGGTGLYIKALLENYDFTETGADEALREELENYAETNGNEALHAKLRELDSAAADKLHFNDRRRIIRAIETLTKGETVSEEKASSPYDAVVFGLTAPREFLYPKINTRVDQMVKEGIFEETKKLLASGLSEDSKSLRSIGYRQIIQYFHKELDKETCIEKIKQATRNFAKRQYTWYKNMPYVIWFEIGPKTDYKAISEEMYNILVKKLDLG